jgi:hypothetical protein
VYKQWGRLLDLLNSEGFVPLSDAEYRLQPGESAAAHREYLRRFRS